MGSSIPGISAKSWSRTKHRTPDRILGAGQARIHAWLKKHGARSSATVAAAAVEAAKSQNTIVPAQHIGEGIVTARAQEIFVLNEELADPNAQISDKSPNSSTPRCC